MNEIIEFIKDNCKGHVRAISVKDLEKKYKLDERQIREVIKDNIMNHNVLILSWEKGFYVPVTEEDFAIGYNHIVAPFEETRKRAEKVKFLWEVQKAKQFEFSFKVG
jgi:hypothetical protein